MNIDRIPDVRPNTPEAQVTVKLCGNVIEIRYMRSIPTAVIEKVNADLYVDKRTGEVKEFRHTANRSDSKNSVSQSLRKLRDLINANLTEPEKALWVTLTYRENMRDTKRLYEDFRRFWTRFRYYLVKYGHPTAEYITAAEPQARGAWHLHCLFLFPEKAPFIPNAAVAHIWGHGFTKTKSLQGIDNPGLYLTAYLGDMELSEALRTGSIRGQIAGVSTTDEQGKNQKKAIVKGARLRLYPPGFNLYRSSRGVKRPKIWQTTEAEAQAIVNSAPLTYEKTIAVTNEAGEVKNIINYRQYNSASKEGGRLDATQKTISPEDT
ncbi:MAG: hypothetical protein SOY27_00830 [Fournierella sp.]|uniref:rolling circle replication-associated protein n=1 Tax=Allofournierella sp. TaxID=1940256 RepID=UPI002A818895|nr:hypothetical protein [Fournierella sp.]MDY4166018.1 hypothetical protein [Fournierella sp.]